MIGVIPKSRVFTSGARDLASSEIAERATPLLLSLSEALPVKAHAPVV